MSSQTFVAFLLSDITRLMSDKDDARKIQLIRIFPLLSIIKSLRSGNISLFGFEYVTLALSTLVIINILIPEFFACATFRSYAWRRKVSTLLFWASFSVSGEPHYLSSFPVTMTIMYTSSDSNNTTIGISYLHGANLTIDDTRRQLNPNHWWYLWTTKGLGSLQFYFKDKSFWWLFLIRVNGFVFPRTSRSSSNTKRFKGSHSFLSERRFYVKVTLNERETCALNLSLS